mmetsp:Transcript_26896/g.38963  ORF Transcript_26896/g.38963 Transcript_26896/m.38963 type:complete len:659 (+) Transcript_26896:33-2009(+)
MPDNKAIDEEDPGTDHFSDDASISGSSVNYFSPRDVLQPDALSASSDEHDPEHSSDDVAITGHSLLSPRDVVQPYASSALSARGNPEHSSGDVTISGLSLLSPRDVLQPDTPSALSTRGISGAFSGLPLLSPREALQPDAFSASSDEDSHLMHATMVPDEQNEDVVTADCVTVGTALMIDDPKKKKIKVDLKDRRTQMLCFIILTIIIALTISLILVLGTESRGGKTIKLYPPTADRPDMSSPTLTRQPTLSPSVSGLSTITPKEFEWTQFGQDLKGSQYTEHFGDHVAISGSGDRIAIGSPGEFENSTQVGHVSIYDAYGQNWNLTGKMFSDSAGDVFGEYITISGDGNRVAVGAQDYKNGTGYVKVFEFNPGSWESLGQSLLGDQVGSNFGRSVEISGDGNALCVGANKYSFDGSERGLVRVFNYSNGSWAQIGNDILGENPGDNAGNRVSISNDGHVVAIGAHNHFGSDGDRSGHVTVFRYNGGVNKTWKQIGDIEGEAKRDKFGRSVSLSGDGNVLAAGSKLHDVTGNKNGAVWVYRYNNSTGDWDLSGKMAGQGDRDEFGHTVSLSNDGNVIAISSIGTASRIGGRSYVEVYKYRSQKWSKIGATIFGENDTDDTGDSISLSANGTRLVVGSPKNDEVTKDSGLVQVYDLNNL